MGVEGGLDLLQARIERAEEGGRVLGAHALAVLAPQHPAILAGERHHLVGDLADERLLRRVGHVDGRADMEHAGIDMAEHAVDEAAAVEGGAELGDVVGEVLGGTAVSSTKGMGRRPPSMLPEEADRLLAHAPDALHRPIREGGGRPSAILLGLVAVLGDAQPCASVGAPGSPAPSFRATVKPRRPRPALLLQRGGDASELGLELVGVVGQQLDQVDPSAGPSGSSGKNSRTSCQTMSWRARRQHPRVDGLDRGRLHGDQGARVAQGGVEAVVADVDQRRVLRDRQHVQLGLGDEARACPPPRTGWR